MIVVWAAERRRYEAITSFLERSVPKEARWRWDPGIKRWYAPSEDLAQRLARYATGPAALRLIGLSPEEKAALAASMASDADIEIPVPAGLAYLPYQHAGIAYALARFGDIGSPRVESHPRSRRLGEEGGFSPSRGGVLIADEMG